MTEQELPVYSFTMRPSKKDIKQAAKTLVRRTGRRYRPIAYIFIGVLVVLDIAMIISSFLADGDSTLTIPTLVFFLYSLVIIGDILFGSSYRSEWEGYIKDHLHDVGQQHTVRFYMDRVEVDGPTGHLIHAYTVYDELVLFPEMCFLMIFEYRGEHLPLSIVPDEQRDEFTAFLIDRANVYEVPVNDRRMEKTRRKSK